MTRTESSLEIAILERMDAAAQVFEFPVLDNLHFRIGDGRLSAFMAEEWLVVFELLVYDVRTSAFETILYAFGNRLNRQGFQTGVTLFEELYNQPYADDKGNSLVDLSSFNIVRQGKVKQFSPTEQDYIRAGIVPEMQMEPEAKLLRYVCAALRPQLFLPLPSLFRHLKLTPIPQFIELYEWSHPDIAGNELPSRNECIKRLAKAMGHSDPIHYRCPNSQMNSHWSNWLVPALW